MPKVSDITLFLLAVSSTLASPVADVFSQAGLKNIHWPAGRPLPVKITKSPSGQRLGWVRRDAQVSGSIAATPPRLKAPKVVNGKHHPKSELLEPAAEVGPPGTVPFQLLTTDEVQNLPSKRGPPRPGSESKLMKRAINGHYYGNSGQTVKNWGGAAHISLFDPATGQNSFSLIQIGCTFGNQTAEMGWQVFPGLHNGSTYPYIFTYYTVNNYATTGDYQGCYNTICKGWVQVSDTYSPGVTFSNISTIDGPQYEIPIRYYFYQGNWWASVNGEYMGYYPGSLYARNNSTANTLGSGSSYIGFWGETYENPAAPPKVDMGSGRFASAGSGKAAYMHNIVYLNSSSGTAANYNGATAATNASWYTIAPFFNSGTTWKSYFYVGGPGAG